MPTHLGSTGAAGVSNSFTLQAGTSRMAICSVGMEFDTAPSSVTATLGGTSITLLDSALSGGGTQTALYSFYVDEATLAAIGTGSKALVFTVTGGVNAQGFSSTFIHFSSASQATPTKVPAGGTSGTSATVNVTVAAANAALVGVVHHNDAGGATVEGSGFTPAYDAASSGSDARSALEYKTGVAAGSPTVNFTLPSSTRWAHLGIAIEDVGGGAAPNPPCGWQQQGAMGVMMAS